MFEYVDEKHKICMFGYGAINISVIGCRMIFKGIKPPQGAGTLIWSDDRAIKIGNWEYTGSLLYICIRSMNDIITIQNQIQTIEENHGGSFNFDNITLDFSYYSPESIQLFKNGLELVSYNILPGIAC